MPYSDEMPALVYPNTDQGRREGAAAIAGEPYLANKVYYCLEWEPRGNNPAQCRNAHADGVMTHNLCFRCPAGFIRMQMDERDFEKRKIGLRTDL